MSYHYCDISKTKKKLNKLVYFEIYLNWCKLFELIRIFSFLVSSNLKLQALQVAVRLEGDVITANGSILSGYIGHDSASIDADNASICSCHCACFRASRHRK